MYYWAISGGGSKWAWELGVATYLAQQGEDPDGIVGISAGALHAAKLCQYPKGRMHEAIVASHNVLKGLSNGKIYNRWYPGGVVGDIIGLLFKKGIYDAAPLHALVHELIDVPAIRSSGRDMAVGAVSLDSGDISYLGTQTPGLTDEDLERAVVASASYPAFFEPVEFRGSVWSDGGLRDVTPLKAAIGRGATRVDVICSQPEHEGPWAARGKPVIQQIPRLLGIQSSEICNNDLEVICDEHQHVEIRVFRPPKGLGDGLDFDTEKLKRWANEGFDLAQQLVQNGDNLRPTRGK